MMVGTKSIQTEGKFRKRPYVGLKDRLVKQRRDTRENAQYRKVVRAHKMEREAG